MTINKRQCSLWEFEKESDLGDCGSAILPEVQVSLPPKRLLPPSPHIPRPPLQPALQPAASYLPKWGVNQSFNPTLCTVYKGWGPKMDPLKSQLPPDSPSQSEPLFSLPRAQCSFLRCEESRGPATIMFTQPRAPALSPALLHPEVGFLFLLGKWTEAGASCLPAL